MYTIFIVDFYFLCEFIYKLYNNLFTAAAPRLCLKIKGGQMKDVFYFNAMLTPKIITFVYWLLLLFAVISGLSTMFVGYDGITFGKFLMGLGIIIGGGVGSRIWCELLIVLFKIHENIKKIADK